MWFIGCGIGCGVMQGVLGQAEVRNLVIRCVNEGRELLFTPVKGMTIVYLFSCESRKRLNVYLARSAACHPRHSPVPLPRPRSRPHPPPHVTPRNTAGLCSAGARLSTTHSSRGGGKREWLNPPRNILKVVVVGGCIQFPVCVRSRKSTFCTARVSVDLLFTVQTAT